MKRTVKRQRNWSMSRQRLLPMCCGAAQSSQPWHLDSPLTRQWTFALSSRAAAICLATCLACSAQIGNAAPSYATSSTNASGLPNHTVILGDRRFFSRPVSTSFCGLYAPVPEEDDGFVPRMPDKNLHRVLLDCLDISRPITRDDLLNISLLNIGRNGIRDLTGLEHAKRMSALTLYENLLFNIRPLTDATGLTWLVLHAASVTDIAPLRNMRSLTSLSLSFNPIRDFSPVSGLVNLEYFGFVGCYLFEGDAWHRRYGLNDCIDDGRVQLPDISPLGNLRRLEHLIIRDTTLDDIGPIFFLNGLQSLDLEHNNIHDVSPLFPLTALRFLNLRRNRIIEIDEVFFLQALTYLDLAWNQISDISPLFPLRELTELHLNGNRIQAIDALFGLVKLRELTLKYNQVSDLLPLCALRALETLDVSNNRVERIPDCVDPAPSFAPEPARSSHSQRHGARVSNLGALTRLNASGNLISDLEPLSAYPNLTHLDLEQNSITDLGPLLTIRNLEEVKLSGNPLSPHSIFIHLAALRANGASVSAVAPAAIPQRPIAFLPPASDQLRQGFVRLINHSSEPGDLKISPVDDSGHRYSELSVTLDAGGTVHFNSDDLEMGNPALGLDRGTGSGTGDWRLDSTSQLYVQTLSYVRTRDGFLTSMHDVVPMDGDIYHVAIFNPASNAGQVSSLRLVNPTDQSADVTIVGTDDVGDSPGQAVRLSLPPNSARAMSSVDLEAGGQGLRGALGDGQGKWRLAVKATEPILVINQLESPTGHITNLSTVPKRTETGTHLVPLFPAAGDALGRQGFVRVINHSQSDGEVLIAPFDTLGAVYEPIRLLIGAAETKHFNSDDLEFGNAGKGLPQGVGPGTGAWHLELSSDLDIEVLSFIRTADGFVTAMHDVAPAVDGRHWLVVFNPGSNQDQVSRLRLVNTATENASVRILGEDDLGRSPGTEILLDIPARATASYTAAELEAGGWGRRGALRNGAGKWKLMVESDQPIVALSIMESPTGHITNLSTAPTR